MTEAASANQTSGSPPAVQPSTRESALDGFRGVAAFVVLLSHCALTVPTVAHAVLRSREAGVSTDDPEWWLCYTPLNLLVSGKAAVLAFFVLSGVVLTFPVLRSDRFDWLAYYPRRLLRLYLPVAAAIGFAVVTFLLVQRHIDPSQGPWITRAHETYAPLDVLRDMFLLGWVSGAVSPLWTLFYEVWFSLTIPLYILVARLRPSPWLLVGAGGVVLLVTSTVAISGPLFALRYFPVFGAGVALAFLWTRLRALTERLNAKRHASVLWACLAVVGIVLATLPQSLMGIGVDVTVSERLDASVVLGVTLLLCVAAFSPWGNSLFRAPTVRFLGRISFSLYLVHEPIVIAVQQLTHQLSPLWTPALAVPIALGAAWLFERQVERPLHELSRRVGRRVSERKSRSPLATAGPVAAPSVAGSNGL